MERKIKNALVSVHDKTGLAPVVNKLADLGISMYSTGGTYDFIAAEGIACTKVEDLTGFPSIFGGRVKTLHPNILGGILFRRDNTADREQAEQYGIPGFDLVIVNLYPFEETLKKTTNETDIIEMIDIGGVSLLRAAAKNYTDVLVVSSKRQYDELLALLESENGSTTTEQRKKFAASAFAQTAHYDVTITGYFHSAAQEAHFQLSHPNHLVLRYGENPHQKAGFYGDLDAICKQLSGKDLSYNNLSDIDAAMQLMAEFSDTAFAIIKHTNVCGIAMRPTVSDAWEAALAGDPESAFGGVLITNGTVDADTAAKISNLFFEVLIAPAFDDAAVVLLTQKKNRILLQQHSRYSPQKQHKRVLNGVLLQDADTTNIEVWTEAGARPTTAQEKVDLVFANLVCKHLKSNAIAIVRNMQLIGKGCGQTSRIDAVTQAIMKVRQHGGSPEGAVLASDAFFPFADSVQLAHLAGITAIIQPGGSIRDNDSIDYCKEHGIAMVLTGKRHFRH